MTEQDATPMTRRQLRIAQQQATAPHPTLPAAVPTSEDSSLGDSDAPVALEAAPAPVVTPDTPAPVVTSDAPSPAPTSGGPAPRTGPTRRELRLAALAAQQEAEAEAEALRTTTEPTPAGEEADAPCPEPFALVVGPTADSRRAARRGTERAHPRVRRQRLAKPATLAALAATLLVSGVGMGEQATAGSGTDAAAQQAGKLARQIARSTTAHEARLSAQAEAWASAERATALAAAQEALAGAGATRASAEGVLDPAALAALESALAELETLVEVAPQVPVAPAGAEDLREADIASRADGSGRGAVPEDAKAEGSATEDTAAGAAAAGAAAETAAGTAAADAASVPQAAPSVPAVDSPAAPTADASATDTPATGAAAGTTAAADDAAVAAVTPETADELNPLHLTDLLASTADMVKALSTEVQAAAQAREAEIAAEAAEAAERARKVEIAMAAGNGRIPEDALCGLSFAPDELLRCDAADALEALNAAYRADFGRDLDVVSSYRSYSAQVSTRYSRGYLAAQPGTSNHGLGLAVDFGDFGGLGNFRTANYRWMQEHGPRHGWFHPDFMEPGGGGPQEPWHWEFGEDTAQY